MTINSYQYSHYSHSSSVSPVLSPVSMFHRDKEKLSISTSLPLNVSQTLSSYPPSTSPPPSHPPSSNSPAPITPTAGPPSPRSSKLGYPKYANGSPKHGRPTTPSKQPKQQKVSHPNNSTSNSTNNSSITNNNSNNNNNNNNTNNNNTGNINSTPSKPKSVPNSSNGPSSSGNMYPIKIYTRGYNMIFKGTNDASLSSKIPLALLATRIMVTTMP